MDLNRVVHWVRSHTQPESLAKYPDLAIRFGKSATLFDLDQDRFFSSA
jgi:hypothetical protein